MKFTRSVLAVLALLVCTACVHTPPNLGPVGQTAWKADRAVLGFEALVDGAVGLNKINACDKSTPPHCQPLLSKGNADLALSVSRSAVLTLKKTPDGWRDTTTTALAEIRKKLDDSGKTQLGSWLGVLDAILKEQQ